MAGQQVDTDFVGGIPGFDLVEAISALEAIDHWFMASADTCTIEDGKIAAFVDLLNPSTVTMDQATAGQRAILDDEQIGTWPAAQFVKADGVQYLLTGATFDPTTPFCVISDFRRRDANLENSVVAGCSSSCYWGFVGSSATNFLFRWGSATITAPVTVDDWHWFIADYDGVNIRLSVDGGAVQSTAAIGAPSTPGALVWGNTTSGSAGNKFDGQGTDLIVGSGAVLADPTARDLFRQYFAGTLGI